MQHTHQGLPEDGYHSFMKRMLDGIPRVLGCDYLQCRAQFTPRRKTIFTGPIDEFFGYDLGRLQYRGQRRAHTYDPHADRIQPCPQVNNPSPADGPHIRTIEWKHLLPPAMRSQITGTLYTRETPFTPTQPDQYEYPFPDNSNQRLYARYRQRALSLDDVLICGRLGEYSYYDMDQAIGRARLHARQMMNGSRH
jgi:UDP-galactopyranose mutase